MSTVSGLPSKGEKGKPKYLALDINNIYKGKSLENPKTSAAPKHGLQSLGKYQVEVKDGGSAGKEKGKSPEENSSGPQQQSQHSQSPTSHSQGPPASKGGPGSGVTVGGGVGSSAGVKTWSSVTSSQEGGGPERNFLGHQSPFFPQEFPKLAGGDVPIDGTQRSATDSQYGPGPSLRPQMEGTWSRGTLQQQPPPQQQQQQQQQQVPGGGSGGGWWRAGLWPTRRPASEQWQWRERSSIVRISAKGSPPLRRCHLLYRFMDVGFLETMPQASLVCLELLAHPILTPIVGFEA
ncbi:hypothetical protein MRX96_009046 [Rhipicephalus microplus]